MIPCVFALSINHICVYMSICVSVCVRAAAQILEFKTSWTDSRHFGACRCGTVVRSDDNDRVEHHVRMVFRIAVQLVNAGLTEDAWVGVGSYFGDWKLRKTLWTPKIMKRFKNQGTGVSGMVRDVMRQYVLHVVQEFMHDPFASTSSRLSVNDGDEQWQRVFRMDKRKWPSFLHHRTRILSKWFAILADKISFGKGNLLPGRRYISKNEYRGPTRQLFALALTDNTFFLQKLVRGLLTYMLQSIPGIAAVKDYTEMAMTKMKNRVGPALETYGDMYKLKETRLRYAGRRFLRQNIQQKITFDRSYWEEAGLKRAMTAEGGKGEWSDANANVDFMKKFIPRSDNIRRDQWRRQMGQDLFHDEGAFNCQMYEVGEFGHEMTRGTVNPLTKRSNQIGKPFTMPC
eukprot:GHVU01106892.1.p1 GENE.GHVU01106892.1~~GHVU01106892.1.p1  ORF type:complete len:401 (+),score=39.54 GHVU01106892.1:990-2192(+)